ncbi:MFS transporter [Nocardiopsis alba]|uniref:MFS transporter n=2 Tax=Nocardiopsis alba TaxID=53437 RepID=UPI0033F85FAA
MSQTLDTPRATGVPRPLAGAFVLGAFALGTSENVIAGVLAHLSTALAVPVSTVGLLVTGYAATAVVAGPLLSLVTGRLPLRRLALLALSLYGAGTVVAVIAPAYTTLMAARIITGALHTTVLVTFMLSAVRLAPEDRRGREVGRITLGLGVATVLGVPLGNLLAQTLGWRWAFGLITLSILVTLVLVFISFPRDEAPRGSTGPGSLRVLTRGPVLGGVAMSAAAGLGAMTLLAYAVPFLTDGAGVPDRAVAPILLLQGAACLAGNLVGGGLADRNLPRALTLSLSMTAIALVIAALVSGTGPGAAMGLALVGFAYFSTLPPLNTWIATKAEGIAPALALAVNSSAFNVGIAAAGRLGGVVSSGPLGPGTLPLLGVAPLLLALVIARSLRAREHHRTVESTGVSRG